MKSENRMTKNGRVNRFRPIAVQLPGSEKSSTRFCAQAKSESKRERQRRAVLDVLRLWSTGELWRGASELD